MLSVIDQLEGIGIVPVIALDDAEKAAPLARALVAGGIPCAEVTFRTAAGEEAIRRIAKEVPEVLVGAGTVLTVEQVDRAEAAGAKFIVSPGFNPRVVDHCLAKGLTVFPGCATPSEMEQALERGITTVKFFPAEAAGGLAFLKAVSAPYRGLRFMPTGGVGPANLAEYLAFERIVACGGSWMVKPELVNEGRFGEITVLCAAAVSAMLGFELRHIGINAQNETEALAAARAFDVLFGFAVKPGRTSVFAGSAIEVMKQPYRGAHGHIAIGTGSVKRAVAHLRQKGFVFAEDTQKTDAKGSLVAIYLQEEILGFAVHLVQK